MSDLADNRRYLVDLERKQMTDLRKLL